MLVCASAAGASRNSTRNVSPCGGGHVCADATAAINNASRHTTRFIGTPLSEKASKVFAPPRPVVTEDAAPEFRMVRNSLGPQQLREIAVLLHQRVVLAGGDDPRHARQLGAPLAVHVRDVGH